MAVTRWTALVTMLMVVLGCAAPRGGGPPAGAGGGVVGAPVPIDDVSRVAGRWTGLMDLPGGSRESEQYVELDLRPDGTYHATSARTIGLMDARGKVEVNDGRLLVQGERGARGRGTLFSRDGRPTLVIDMTLPNGGQVTARLHPQR